jgi:hypothetical protein
MLVSPGPGRPIGGGGGGEGWGEEEKRRDNGKEMKGKRRDERVQKKGGEVREEKEELGDREGEETGKVTSLPWGTCEGWVVRSDEEGEEGLHPVVDQSAGEYLQGGERGREGTERGNEGDGLEIKRMIEW